jgi:hypothetical protein
MSQSPHRETTYYFHALIGMEIAMFRFKYVSLAAIAAIPLLLSLPAKASSILVDHGSVTYDPATKLQWLDVTKTMGLSYNEVLNNVNSNYVKDGWRFATQEQLEQMYRDAGLPVVSNPDGTMNFVLTGNASQPGYATLEHDAFTLGSELGWTNVGGSINFPSYDTTGLFDVTNPHNPFTAGLSTLSLLSYLGPDGQLDVTEYFDTVNKDLSIRNVGSFLVEDVSAVPVPGQATTLAAILLGLTGLNLWRRKELS